MNYLQYYITFLEKKIARFIGLLQKLVISFKQCLAYVKLFFGTISFTLYYITMGLNLFTSFNKTKKTLKYNIENYFQNSN